MGLLKAELERSPHDFWTAICLARIYLEQRRYSLAEQMVDRAFSWAQVDNPDTVCPVTPEQRELFLMKANLRPTLVSLSPRKQGHAGTSREKQVRPHLSIPAKLSKYHWS